LAAGVVKVTIPSDYAAGRDVQERILEQVQRHGFTTDATFAIRIALEEALVNAIKHGNRHDPDKSIRVEARVTKKRAQITIEDEGPGFNRNGIPDPTLEENLHKCSGRGILLIESYMDGVHWSRGGRRLKMVKDNG
jgi:serine/threonine-protein kinase RsbW